MFSTGFAFLKNVSAGGGGYDPDAEAYFTEVLAVGGSLTIPEKDAVNQLVLDLKIGGIWNKLDVFLPVLGTDPEAMVLNLVAPTDTTWTWTYWGTPTLSSTGIKGNGTDAAVLSNWKLNEDLVLSQVNDSHWSCYIKYYGAGTGNYLNGVIDTTGELGYTKGGYGTFGGSAYGGLYGDQYGFSGGPGDSDFNGFIYGENYSDITYPTGVMQLFINNTGYGLATPSPIRPFAANQKIAMLALAWDSQPNGLYQDFSTSEIRSWSMGAYLSPAQKTAYYNAVVAYQTALGRTA